MSHAKLAQEAVIAQWLYLARLGVIMLICKSLFKDIRNVGWFEWTHVQKDEGALIIILVVQEQKIWSLFHFEETKM